MIAAVAGLGLAIGLVIGALGGGGGVLTVPVLVYLLGQSAQDATTSSALIVGITAAVGALVRARAGLVRWRTGLAFGAAGVPAALLGTVVNRSVDEPVLLLAFAALTLLTAATMLVDGRRGHRAGPPPEPAAAGTVAARPRARTGIATTAQVVGLGLAVGFLTGFLGVGGGFLVVPALVIALRMPMNPAIDTSLMVIALNAVAALASRGSAVAVDWAVVVPFTVAAIAGTLAGRRVSDRCSAPALTRGFAVLLLAVGTFVAVRSILSW